MSIDIFVVYEINITLKLYLLINDLIINEF